jgi:hypothetical protein
MNFISDFMTKVLQGSKIWKIKGGLDIPKKSKLLRFPNKVKK